MRSAGNENVCVSSYTICVILAVIDLAISIGIGAYFAYFRWYLKIGVTHVKFGICAQGMALKQQFNQLINEKKNQTNRDQKSNLLSLQRHN